MSVLDRIVEATRDEVERRRELVPLAALEAALGERPRAAPVPGGADPAGHLGDRRAQAPLAVGGRDPRGRRRWSRSSRAYERGGAAALSILTEPFHFGGSLDDLRAARAATHLPVLRKDFIVDPYQLVRVRGRGRRRDPADRRRARARRRCGELHREAWALDLDVLVEVHDEEELEIALEVEAEVIGINNRDLGDFTRRHRAHVRAARPTCRPARRSSRSRASRRASSSTSSTASASTPC